MFSYLRLVIFWTSNLSPPFKNKGSHSYRKKHNLSTSLTTDMLRCMNLYQEVYRYSCTAAYLQFTILLLGYAKLSYTSSEQKLQIWIWTETYWAHNINDWGQSSLVFCIIEPCLFSNKGPQFIQIDSRTELLVFLQVIVSHAYFSKVARVTVKENTFLVRSHF